MPFSLWGPTCDTIDYMKGPFLLPSQDQGRRLHRDRQHRRLRPRAGGRFNGYGAFEEAILLDEPMLTMYGAAEEGAAQQVQA